MSTQKLSLNHPTMILLYGYPGAGKSFFARQLCEDLQAAHVQGERIRYELFDQPRFDKQENEIIVHLMDYMTEEFLRAGVSVVYDTNAMRLSQRRELREMARKSKAKSLLIWLQIDVDSAFARISRRDHRKIDDKYSVPLDRNAFESLSTGMQNPETTEDYIVISGKHTYQTQRSSTIKKLYDIGLIGPSDLANKVVKPGMVNLVPNPLAGRVDPARRNITIR